MYFSLVLQSWGLLESGLTGGTEWFAMTYDWLYILNNLLCELWPLKSGQAMISGRAMAWLAWPALTLLQRLSGSRRLSSSGCWIDTVLLCQCYGDFNPLNYWTVYTDISGWSMVVHSLSLVVSFWVSFSSKHFFLPPSDMWKFIHFQFAAAASTDQNFQGFPMQTTL